MINCLGEGWVRGVVGGPAPRRRGESGVIVGVCVSGVEMEKGKGEKSKWKGRGGWLLRLRRGG